MPDKVTRTYIKDVAEKQDTGVMGQTLDIGVPFENVFDQRLDKDGYNLAQFFDNYMDFITSAYFMYYGAEEPTNSHIKIWIDTSKTNQD